MNEEQKLRKILNIPDDARILDIISKKEVYRKMFRLKLRNIWFNIKYGFIAIRKLFIK